MRLHFENVTPPTHIVTHLNKQLNLGILLEPPPKTHQQNICQVPKFHDNAGKAVHYVLQIAVQTLINKTSTYLELK